MVPTEGTGSCSFVWDPAFSLPKGWGFICSRLSVSFYVIPKHIFCWMTFFGEKLQMVFMFEGMKLRQFSKQVYIISVFG